MNQPSAGERGFKFTQDGNAGDFTCRIVQVYSSRQVDEILQISSTCWIWLDLQ